MDYHTKRKYQQLIRRFNDSTHTLLITALIVVCNTSFLLYGQLNNNQRITHDCNTSPTKSAISCN